MPLQTSRIFSLLIAVCLATPILAQELEAEPAREPGPVDPAAATVFDPNQPLVPRAANQRVQIAPKAAPVATPMPAPPNSIDNDQQRSIWPTPRPSESDIQGRYPQKLTGQQLVMYEQLQRLKQELLEAHKKLEEQQTKSLPPLENGKLHAYRLQHIDPQLLAETLESFLGTSQLRLVPDVENKVLLTYSSDDVSKQIDDLVKVLDAANESAERATYENAAEAQALLIRIFWLADGIGEANADDYLPKSVIDAVRQLGLEQPLLLSQSSTAVADKQGKESHFRFNFPAIIGYETLQFESEGEIILGRQPQLDLHIGINSGYSHIELAGKLNAPLGHYMVLGTANYLAGTQVSSGGGGGFGGGGAGSVKVDGGKPTTSQFAFVVQVVEAESFVPDEANQESKGVR